MDDDLNHLSFSYREIKSYFSYGGDDILILSHYNAFLSQFDNCLFAAPLPNTKFPISPKDFLLKEALLRDKDLKLDLDKREVLCILDSNEENFYNGKSYSNKCVISLGGISRYAINPSSDLLFVVFSNNILCVYSLLSDKQNWIYLHLLSALKINNNNNNVNTICVSENNDVCFGLMEGTVLVYNNNKFNHSFKLKNSTITLIKCFKSEKLFICNKLGDLYLYDKAKKAKLAYFQDHTTYVKSLNYIVTKDNEIGLITLDNDNIINLWSLSGRVDKTSKGEDLVVNVSSKNEPIIPFKRIIKHENITSIEVVSGKLTEELDSKRKGSWMLLIIEESGKLYYLDPIDESVLHKNTIMYGFGLVKKVDVTKEMIMLLSLNGTIIVYDKLFNLVKLFLSNFNNLFQFILVPSSNDLRSKDQEEIEEEFDLENSEDLEIEMEKTVQTNVRNYYEYSLLWYNKYAINNEMMIILIGDEVLRILLLNNTNEFIPLGLYNTSQTHKDVITTIHYNKEENLLLSGSKDKLIILWDLSKLIQLKLINTINVVTSVLMIARPNNTVDVISSNDNIINLYTVKLNDLKSELYGLCGEIVLNNKIDEKSEGVGDVNADKSNHTSVVHKTNINYLSSSHNQKYISSCSSDKLIVIHYSNNLIVKGKCIGHRKSVLYTKFMKLTKTLISTSMDQTIRIWNLSNFTNIKILQGHNNSVMKVVPLDNNLQLLSCGLDGYVKLWNLPTSECIQTLNNHENDKIWDIDLHNNLLYSISNNLIVVYEDSSKEERRLKALKDHEEEIVTSQINSLMLENNFRESLTLSIKLNNIKLTNDILQKFRNKVIFQGQKLENDPVDYVIEGIREGDEKLLNNLIGFIKIWITNRKDYLLANVFINKLLKEVKLEQLLKVEGLLETIDFLLYNLSHHQNRLTNLQEKSYLMDMLTHDNTLSELNTNAVNEVLYNSK
ncbi:transducin-like G-protein beta, putative [Theileria annulata]|uniref:Transducin-like G-protein beta, putative n=1 Tax=Theileria annulata TaxID=5874 RepID=Q4UF17_THEAN|nr:transducin-like G-protein beta, putative [Theileria annulata]CAI74322.1 transducin-like G-protein beta, putative [Theileria annulata]|eukprot:XP_952054.1 transducin-like G-protein beta, putative [Theileria annulata]